MSHDPIQRKLRKTSKKDIFDPFGLNFKVSRFYQKIAFSHFFTFNNFMQLTGNILLSNSERKEL